MKTNLIEKTKGFINLYEALNENNMETENIEYLQIKLNETLTYIIDLYNKPIFQKFDIIKFYSNKSKLYLICSNLLELQKNLILEPLYIEQCKIYLNSLFEKNDIFAPFMNICLDFMLDIENGILFTMEDIKNYIIDSLIDIIQTDNEINFKKIIQLTESENKLLIDELNELKISIEDYQIKITEIYYKLNDDIEFMINCYPEYHSKHLCLENNVLRSIHEVLFFGKNKYKVLTLPKNTLIFKNEIDEFNMENYRVYQKEVGTFMKNVLSKILRFLPYKNYTYSSNISLISAEKFPR